MTTLVSERYHRVSAHALVRWIDRIEHIGVEAIRQQLGGVEDYVLLSHLRTAFNIDVE